MSKLSNEELYSNFLKASKSLMEAEAPLDNRVMYYKIISWWRHPFKRLKQKRQLKSLLVTKDDL